MIENEDKHEEDIEDMIDIPEEVKTKEDFLEWILEKF